MTHATMNHPLFNDQLALEEEMRSMGIERFRMQIEEAQKNNNESRTQSVRRIMGHVHSAVVEGIEAFIAEASSGRAGRKHGALKFIKLLDDVDMVAHMTIRSVMDSISTTETLQRAAVNLATLLEDEVHFRVFKEAIPRAFDKLHKIASESANERYRRNVMLMPARKMGVVFEDWTPTEKVLVGTKLIEIFVAQTHLARVERFSEGTANTPVKLVATPAALNWLAQENNRMECLSPVYLPTIVPPKPWTTPYDGGYWSGRIRKPTLVITRNRQYLDELAEREMPEVYNAVNALQETAWAINPKVLAVMEELWANQSTLGLIPSSEDEEMPPRPTWLTKEMKKEDMNPAQLEQFTDWKRLGAIVHERNAQASGKRIGFTRMLMVARKMAAHSAIYFPHHVDWRGRIYPISLYLQPQGNDTQRGLLQFANTVPLTDEDGVNWLAIHGAGLWGVDKVSMEKRRAWVEANQKAIVASAQDPFENRFWTTAEKPWQALAFCHEWAGWLAEGYAYQSALPVQMDGTCNGLQNFSAILRDAIGGAAVNLTPGLTPNDIYAQVAEVVAKMIEADLHSEAFVQKTRKEEDGTKTQYDGPAIKDLAAGWHGYVNRKVTKRPVMTLAYGAREFGFKTQVFEDSILPWKAKQDGTYTFADGTDWDAAAYMGGLIWDAVQTVVVAAAQAMEWLQAAARVAAKEGLPVLWTTPTGFLVQQEYRVPNIKRIETTFDKIRLRLSIEMGGEKIDIRRQASGISPNWVHSLDASHMIKTIDRCHRDGIQSFSMIHDSYGTHAGNAAVMAAALREEFVAMYQQDVLATFRDDLLAQLGADAVLPELPPKGDLDLNLVLESPFFFA